MANVTLEQALQIASAHHQAGRLAEAEAIYRQVAAQHPQQTAAWHGLGLIALATGRASEAVDLIGKAVAIAPGEPAYHSDQGVACWLLRRAEDAAACFQRALALRPGMAHTHCNLGDVHHALGRPDEAIASYRRALELQPDYANAHNNLGNVLAAQGRMEEAAASYQRAATLNPALRESHANLGDALTKLRRLDEALACLRHAIALSPDFAEAHNNLGNVFWQKKQWDEAMACYRRALELRPAYVDAQSNLGGALLEAGRLDDALAAYHHAVEIDPAYPDAHGNMGVAYLRKGMFDNATASYRRAIACKAAFADGHWNLSLILLLTGHYEEGWREHEWRWRTLTPVSPLRGFAQPQWDGSPAPGETILLHAEQGFGDTIQFMRYLPLVRSRVGRAIIECPAKLTRLLAQNGVDVVERQGWDDKHLPPFDRHLPLLSLPLVLQQYPPLAIAGPYLHADPELRLAWRERLGPATGPRVGVAWAGRPDHGEDARRSIPFARLSPALRAEGVAYYSLQVEHAAGAGLIDLTGHITDFADTAAFIAELDLVIAVDTAVAHLAGALGRRVWLLLPFVPDWRWGLDRTDTPWYPTMRIFRQPAAGDWESVVQRVAAELNALGPTSP